MSKDRDGGEALTPNQNKVMEYYAECVSPEWVVPFDHVAEGAKMSATATKRAVRQLARLGYLELSTGFNEDDGLIAGRGYMLTRSGCVWKDAYWAALATRAQDSRKDG